MSNNENSIDRQQLLSDVHIWLPVDNLLDDNAILSIAEMIIATVGDHKKHYPEVLCKLLGALADANLVKSGGVGGVVSEKVGDHSVSYGSVTGNPWKAFKDSLVDICPIFGYIPTNRLSKAVINVGEWYDPITGKNSLTKPNRAF